MKQIKAITDMPVQVWKLSHFPKLLQKKWGKGSVWSTQGVMERVSQANLIRNQQNERDV